MISPLTRAVFRNEVRSLVRDRRAFLAAVVLPVLLYPLLFIGMGQLGDISESTLEDRDVTIASDLSALDEATAGRVRAAWADPLLRMEVRAAPDELLARIAAVGEEAHEPLSLGADLDALVTSYPGAAGEPARVCLWADRSSDRGNLALERAGTVLRDLAEEVRGERLLALVERDPGAPLLATTLDVARPEDAAGHALGRLLPVIAVLVLLSGASFAALGAFAAEREAGTLETLLVQPVPARAAAGGKFLAVLAVGIVALLGNVGSFVACTVFGLGAVPGATEAQATAMEPGRILLGLLLFLPPTVLLAALACLVSARARSFREGQHYVFPLILLAAAPASLALLDQVELGWGLALVPIAGASLAFRDAMAGAVAPGPAIASVVAGAVWAWLALDRVAGTLDAERLLASGDTEGEMAVRRIQSRRALAWGFAAVAIVYVVGGRLQAVHLAGGLLATLWILAVGLAVLAARGTARRAREPLSTTLGLNRPAPHHVLGAVLLAPALAVGALWFAEVQSEVLPLPGDLALPGLEGYGTAVLLLLFAVSPAFCEELLFRGALLSGLKKDLGVGRVLVWQAVLFGAVHASIYRFVPTAVLGAVLAAITLRARCIWPAVVLHGTYNGLLVLDRAEPLRQHAGWCALAGLVGALLLAVPRRGR